MSLWKGNKKVAGNGGAASAITQAEINSAVNDYLDRNPVTEGKKDLHFKPVSGTVHIGDNFSYTQKTFRQTGTDYCCIEYALDGTEKMIRFSGQSSGASDRVVWTFVDDSNNIISHAEYIKGELYRDAYVDVPNGATKVYINGGTAYGPHLEVGVEDNMSDRYWLNQLLGRFSNKISYRDKFAWKPMPTGLVAFTFDDSLNATSEIVDLFIRKGVPCCFGAIPDRLGCGTTAGETIAQAMQRGVASVGCEVLSHGTANETVIASNIDDLNFLYSKFVQNRQKFDNYGFDVRGVVRVGGSVNGETNVCNDPRTDVWMKLFYDYGDLYGVEEPYNHPRASHSTEDEYKAEIDKAIRDKAFMPMLFHQPPEFLESLIDYAIEQGAQIVTYAHAYDTYGSTQEMVDILARLDALEN